MFSSKVPDANPLPDPEASKVAAQGCSSKRLSHQDIFRPNFADTLGHTSLTSGLLLLEGNRLVSCNADATVRIWDLNTGKCVHTLIGRHVSAITGMAHIGYGLLATASDDGTAKLWDVENGTYVTNLLRMKSAGKGGCVWRIRADETTLVCAVGSRNGLEDTKLMLVGYDAPYPQL